MTRHPLANAREEWERVLEDAASTAAEYREAEWETLELHPGDVRPLPPSRGPSPDPDDRVGFDVTVPDDEFERLAEWTADADFDEYEAHAARTGEVVFVVVARSESAGRAAFLPLYYAVPRAKRLIARATEAGEVETTVRPLSDERGVTLVQREPSPLFPTAGGDENADGDGDGDSASE